MPGDTPLHGFPTMLDTDPLSDVAEAIRSLANNLDGVDYTHLVLGAGWAGYCQHAYASGLVTVRMAASKSSWALGETIASGIPAAYRPTVALYAFMVTGPGGYMPVQITTAGTVIALAIGASGAGGVYGQTTYVRG